MTMQETEIPVLSLTRHEDIPCKAMNIKGWCDIFSVSLRNLGGVHTLFLMGS